MKLRIKYKEQRTTVEVGKEETLLSLRHKVQDLPPLTR